MDARDRSVLSSKRNRTDSQEPPSRAWPAARVGICFSVSEVGRSSKRSLCSMACERLESRFAWRLTQNESFLQRIVRINQKLMPTGDMSAAFHFRNNCSVFAEASLENNSAGEVRA